MAESPLSSMIASLESREAKIGIFGSGYVGLPLACAFAEAGFHTVACDIDAEKVAALRQGRAYVEDEYVQDTLPSLVRSGMLFPEGDPSLASQFADFAIITVPTPLNERREPELSYIVGVAKEIAKRNKAGKFVILESSVYPGTTEEVLKPILERNGLVAGTHFGLAYSPERIDYGNKNYGFRDIPKIVGGINPLCTEIACRLYRTIIRGKVMQTTSIQAAESTKMLENTYRYVNIALANELAILHEQLGLDFFEVVRAASTKPFGFQAFYPGPGVGGHCIPKDPHYLSYKARQLGVTLKLVEISQEINEGMSNHIVQRLEDFLHARNRKLKGAKVAILGLAFKADVSDTRNSPSGRLAEELRRRSAQVTAYDPLAHTVPMAKGILVSTKDLETAVRNVDIVILATPHTSFMAIDLSKLHDLTNPEATIVDTRGFWSPEEAISVGFHYLGVGRPLSSA